MFLCVGGLQILGRSDAGHLGSLRVSNTAYCLAAPIPPVSLLPAVAARSLNGLLALNSLVPASAIRGGGEADRLPTAHTCFNHMLLPTYTGKEALRQRLEMALENAEGFGLM